jgi:hypothetical protein
MTGQATGGPMATRITYYAIADDLSSPEEPVGVLRRIEWDGGAHDERFGHELEWTPSRLRCSSERGDGFGDLYKISVDEASRIVERIRRTVTGAYRRGSTRANPYRSIGTGWLPGCPRSPDRR